MNLNNAIKTCLDSTLAHTHTALPAKIETYDYTKQKASVKPIINKRFNGKEVIVPIINEVPVSFPRAGVASITFPLNKGDTGLLICSEDSLDTWLSTASSSVPRDYKKFDLSDGIFFPGLVPFTETSHANDNTSLRINYGQASISIAENGDININAGVGKIAIQNQAEELLTILDEFIDSIITGTITTVTGPQLLSTVIDLTIPALKLRLAALKA